MQTLRVLKPYAARRKQAHVNAIPWVHNIYANIPIELPTQRALHVHT
jgi:hypothetical protein